MKLEDFIKIVEPYSMTSRDRIRELFFSLEYIRINDIKGDLVECGVWKGGNILGILEYLEFYKMYNFNVWLYDTFKGMTEPEGVDVDFQGVKADEWKETCYSSLEEVKGNLSKSYFKSENIKYVVGDVEYTLDVKENLPEKISLLRLDTDWYKSTKKELEVLYPFLNKNGILIVDDYGHWKGSKKAVDEYFEKNNITNFEYIDYTAIKIMKNK
jgi:hypothetical protein